MYAVIEYNKYRKEQQFEVITTTDDLEYARRLSFQNAKKNLPVGKTEGIYKITSVVEDTNLAILNKTIISYQIVCLEKHEDRFKLCYSFSIVYAVIELENINMEYPGEIDNSLICDDYFNDEYFSSSDTE